MSAELIVACYRQFPLTWWSALSGKGDNDFVFNREISVWLIGAIKSDKIQIFVYSGT